MPVSHPLPQKKETIIVGLCFMERKLKAKRNKEVYQRLESKQIQIIELWPYFDHHWSTWPVVDVLFQSHTGNFPYIMVHEYIQNHNPFLINDFESEQRLWDRTVTYKTLTEIGVPVPRYFPIYLHENHVDRIQKDCYGKIFTPDGKLIPYEDYLKSTKSNPKLFRQLYNCEQKKFQNKEFTESQNSLRVKSQGIECEILKPFIQKPSYSNDHKVSLYYQESLGGGRRVLYRQNHGHTSSAESYYEKDHSNIRTDQNYIYEEFIGTNVFDIKVYTVGDFIFAQSRRSPMVDVEKDCKNSELRHEVQLTPEEREYCKKIVDKFKLPVCGLDILRSDQKSYVCDINGWAFAKGGGLNQEVELYWDLLADLLRNMVFKKFSPQKAQKLCYQSLKDYKTKIKLKGQALYQNPKTQELRCLVEVISFTGMKNETDVLKIGQKIRKNSYDGLNCLGLYSTFENELKVQSLSDDSEMILIGHFLKGYLGIRGEISPPLISMIKSDRKESLMSKINKILNEFQAQAKKPKLKTFVFVVNEESLEELQNEIQKREEDQKKKGQKKSRIQLKIYEREQLYEKQLQNWMRMEVKMFEESEQRGENEIICRPRSMMMEQGELVDLLNK